MCRENEAQRGAKGVLTPHIQIQILLTRILSQTVNPFSLTGSHSSSLYQVQAEQPWDKWVGEADVDAGTGKDEQREIQSLGRPEERENSGLMRGDEEGSGRLLAGGDI